MVVHLELDRSAPPTGQVRLGHAAAARPFAGWLELLQILSEALADGSGKLDATADPQFSEQVDHVSLDRAPGDE